MTLRKDFNAYHIDRYKQKTLKAMWLMFLYVSFTCIPAWAFAQLPIVNLRVSDWVLDEYGPNTGSFNVSRSGGIISDPFTVVVAVTGSATFISDYTSNPEMSPKDANQYWLVIPAGQHNLTLVITPVRDGINEGDETVIFTLVEYSSYTVGDAPGAQLILVDDSPLVNLRVADWVLDEYGPNTGSFNVSRSGGIISDPFTVVVAVTGSATFTSDYTPNPEMSPKDANQYWLVIPAGQHNLTLVITPVRDGINEGDETVIFTLVEDSSYTVGDAPRAQLILVDDSPLVNLRLGDWVLDEYGPNPGSFSVSRSGGIISDPFTVVVAVTGTATFTSDYTPNPEMSPKDANQYWLVIPAGQHVLTLVITPVQDGIREGDETVIFTLVDDSSYTVGEDPGAQLILVDDSPFVEGIFKDSFEDP